MLPLVLKFPEFLSFYIFAILYCHLFPCYINSVIPIPDKSMNRNRSSSSMPKPKPREEGENLIDFVPGEVLMDIFAIASVECPSNMKSFARVCRHWTNAIAYNDLVW